MNLPRIWIQTRQMWWIIFSMIMQSLKSCQSSVVVSNWGLALKSTLKLCSCIINIPYVGFVGKLVLVLGVFGMLKHFSQLVQSPVYTGRLNRFRIRVKLNRIRVNALIRSVNRFTQPTSGCGLNPGWKRISFEGGACKQLVRFLSGLSDAWRICQYSWQVVQPISHRSASCERRFMS